MGRDSRGLPAYEVNVRLGRRIGRTVTELPGGHVGFATRTGEFARELLRMLAPA